MCCCLHVCTLQVLISLHQWDNSELDNKKTRVNGIELKYVMLLVLDCTSAFIYLFYLLAVLKVLFYVHVCYKIIHFTREFGQSDYHRFENFPLSYNWEKIGQYVTINTE